MIPISEARGVKHRFQGNEANSTSDKKLKGTANGKILKSMNEMSRELVSQSTDEDPTIVVEHVGPFVATIDFSGQLDYQPPSDEYEYEDGDNEDD